MSGQSHNSKPASEGNGDSVLTSYQNSPRKTPEFGSAGPFGDTRTEDKSSNCYVFMMNNDSSPESEEQQVFDLKAEYLDRLKLIRQKLASIDIANYGSYYGNHYNSTSFSPRCEITEIFDEPLNRTENTEYNVTAMPLGEVISIDDEAVSRQNDAEISQENNNKKSCYNEGRKQKNLYTESAICQRIDFNKNMVNDKEEAHVVLNQGSKNTNGLENMSAENATRNNSLNENLCSNMNRENSDPINNTVSRDTENFPLEKFSNNDDLEVPSKLENISSVKGEYTEDPNTQDDDTIRRNFELKTIFKYDNPYDVKSSMELIDLNYNPPKKKYCIREKTPKMIMSDGAMSLPYHMRVSLHSATLKKNNQEPLNEADFINIAEKVKKNIEALQTKPAMDNDVVEEKNKHIFPKVEVDCFGVGDQECKAKESSEGVETFIDHPATSPQKSAGAETEYSVFFFEAVEQSPSDSMKSQKTIVTETTVTDSPSRKPKRRRLLLKSAQNKVKPIDKISLWEEIRTMDALNKQREPESSSSLESYFKNVILSKNNTEPEVDLVSVGSLDIPPKVKSTSRFPSITRITKFCSSIFRKKSQTSVDGNRKESGQSSKDLDQNKNSETKNKKRVMVNTPTAAHTLLNVRKEQDLEVEFDSQTPSEEDYSECSETSDEEDDSFSNWTCPVCFCF